MHHVLLESKFGSSVRYTRVRDLIKLLCPIIDELAPTLLSSIVGSETPMSTVIVSNAEDTDTPCHSREYREDNTFASGDNIKP